MPRPPHSRSPAPRSRFFWLDGDLYYVSDRTDEDLMAVRLLGEDRELALRMLEENDIELESRLLGGWS